MCPLFDFLGGFGVPKSTQNQSKKHWKIELFFKSNFVLILKRFWYLFWWFLGPFWVPKSMSCSSKSLAVFLLNFELLFEEFSLFFVSCFKAEKQCNTTPIECRSVSSSRQRTFENTAIYKEKHYFCKVSPFPPPTTELGFWRRIPSNSYQKSVLNSHRKINRKL